MENIIQKFTFAVQRWSACNDKERANQLNSLANELIAEKEVDKELISAASFFSTPDFWNKFETARENVNRVQKWISSKMNWLDNEMTSHYGVQRNRLR